MRWLLACALVVSVYMLPATASPAHALSADSVAFGASWDGPQNDLQHVVDTYIGTPGAIDVRHDFVGAHPGDLDPWFWVGSGFPAMMVAQIAGNANINELGWYLETGTKPLLGPGNHGVVFDGPASARISRVITFPTGTSKFGFYLDTHQLALTRAGLEEQVFYTNRFYNDIGPGGRGPVHAPSDGDVQALVFDVSKWKGDNTWLVCFEDLDSGQAITPCCDGTDDDYNDLVFVVTALGATPTRTLTFGQLKAHYR